MPAGDTLPTQPRTDLEGRVVLVTGASRGLGAAVALEAATLGARVVLLGRTVGALEELDDRIRSAGGEATLVPMDLTRGAEVDKLGPSLYARFGRLDMLVAAAAHMAPLTPLPHQTPKDWQQVIDTNLTANQRLVRTLDPLLRTAAAGRAIFITCTIARAPKPFWSAYAVSKAGLETLVALYKAETVGTALRVSLVDPGPMATRLRRVAYPGEDPRKLPTPRSAAVAIIKEMVGPDDDRPAPPSFPDHLHEGS